MLIPIPFILTAFACSVKGGLFTDISQLPERTYDFVIIGGKFNICCSATHSISSRNNEAGAAGNVLASRLTENPSFSVLVIEAGVTYVFEDSHCNLLRELKLPQRNEGVVPIAVPFLAPTNQPQSAVTWNYTTVPQSSLNGRILTYPRGRVLGGSSSISGFCG